MNDAEFKRLPNGDTLITIGHDSFTLSPFETARLIEFVRNNTVRPRVLSFPKWPLKKESEHNG